MKVDKNIYQLSNSGEIVPDTQAIWKSIVQFSPSFSKSLGSVVFNLNIPSAKLTNSGENSKSGIYLGAISGSESSYSYLNSYGILKKHIYNENFTKWTLYIYEKH
jgi:hypothetical protein